ncbi:hypothetical protein QBC44DRAFT_234020 [Cladorrhinum sp. PSN332]|nr:hypothetical protein QBC44DRAFT_234020 [Cladorrhinum sp. PSN332]
MTGKRLTDDHRAILVKLLQITKLNNHEIAWVLNVDERTVRRRRDEFTKTGQLAKHKDVSKNAEKLKEHHLEKLVAWHKDHPDALLDDMQLFLEAECNLKVSVPTISRGLRKSYGTLRREGRASRIKSRKQREAEGRTIASELRPNGSANDDEDEVDDDDADEDMDQEGDQEYFEDQAQLAPLQQAMSFQHSGQASHGQQQHQLPLPPLLAQHTIYPSHGGEARY